MNPQGFRWARLSTRLAIYARDDWQCLACSRPVTWKKGRGTWHDCRPSAASLDHLIPKVQGGQNVPTNLLTLCVSCNSSRSQRPLTDWRPELEDRAIQAITTPIDRQLGRMLAAELDPKWTYRVSRANRKARAEERRSA